MKEEKGSKGTVHSAILSGIYGCFYILLFFYSPSTFLIVSQEFSIEFFRWYIWRLFGRFATFSIFFPLCSSLNFLRISSSSFTNVRGFRLNLAVLRRIRSPRISALSPFIVLYRFLQVFPHSCFFLLFHPSQQYPFFLTFSFLFV